MKRIILITAVAIFLLSCGNNENTGEKKDVYNQTWATSNLNVSTFQNGDTIYEAKTNKAWEKTGETQTPAWCYYDNDSANAQVYGKLYNWYAVTDKRNIAPVGWHVPTEAEWTNYITSLGGENVAGGKIKDTTYWHSPNTGATNETGYAARPGGWRDYNGTFGSMGLDCDMWCSTDSSLQNAWGYNVILTSERIFKSSYNKGYGFALRCVKD